MEASSNSTKQGWTNPELTVYGDVAKITADTNPQDKCIEDGGDGVTKLGMGTDNALGSQAQNSFSCAGIARW